MRRDKLFFLTCLSFIFSLGLFSLIPINFKVIGVFLLLFLFSLFFKKYFFTLLFLFLGFFLGTIAIYLNNYKINPSVIAFYNNDYAVFEGVVSQEPDSREAKQRLTIKTSQLLSPDIKKINGKVLVTANLYPQYQYGDKLEISCQLKMPEKIEDFDYDKYLSRYNIYSLCYYPKIKFLEHTKANFFYYYIYKVKNYFVFRLNKILSEPQASFLAGLLIGARKSIPADLTEVFRITGTTHIIAVSGFNITIIVNLFAIIFIKYLPLPRKASFALVLLAIFVFVIITGAPASIIRAALMGCLVLIAQYLGRLSKIANTLIFSAVVMLIVNPKILIYDAGFQLSFLATIGLVYLTPILEKYFCWLPEKFTLQESITTTMAAIVMTLPLILFSFGNLSIIAPISNLLILPFIPIAMAFGFLAGIVALFSIKLGAILGWLVWLVLTYMIKVLELLSRIPYAYIKIENFSVFLLIGSYLLMILWIKKNISKINIG